MDYAYLWPEVPEAAELFTYAGLPASVPGMLAAQVEASRDRTAIIDGDHQYTYGELWRDSGKAAALLRALGVRPGDRVALRLSNSWVFVVWVFGILRAGGIVVPTNHRLTDHEWSSVSGLVSPRFVVSELGGDQGLGCHVLEADAFRQMSDINGDSIDDGSTRGIGVLFLTSGTTSTPKAVALTHENLLTSAQTYCRLFGLTPSDSTMVMVPLCHVTGFVGQLLALIIAGGSVVLAKRFAEQAFLDAMARHNVSHFFGVPTIYARLNAVLSERAQFPHWRIAACGGAPLPVTLARDLLTKLPSVSIFNTYGMTEVSSPATILPANEIVSRPASVGRPVPFARLRVVSSETGTDVGPGEVGELWIHGPMVTEGYWHDPTETREKLTDGWIKSGDLARIDDDGFVYITGRLKDLVNRGGEKIAPAEVEQVLYEHPDIAEVSVVGIPHRVWGEELAALVVAKPERSPEANQVQTWARQHLASFKVPQCIVIGRDIPKNPNGKVDKNAVRAIITRVFVSTDRSAAEEAGHGAS